MFSELAQSSIKAMF
ncbi:hypothetical protein OSK59_22735 [Escherichia coli]|nr:hypothetical protein [Escherichia coli]MCN4796703.1 hypothetical protein [Escherichia coli]MDA6341148.1 hypothetical protein [Escherichia coli]MEC6078835.1 hypothetical protein [Escherichia coli]UUH80353.1 hypothetical protein NP442_12970 [Escherichia coli]WOY36096.1 hypothetical protein R6I08_13040 [Escherichia coli]